MSSVNWKGEARTIDELAAAVESLCLPGQPILSPVHDEPDADSDQQGGAGS